jgi:hypothetical protein
MSTERTQEAAFPFTYQGWDECGGDFGDIIFYKPEFTEDFGPIKKGDTFDSVAVLHCQGVLECYRISGPKDDHGCTPMEVAHTLKFKVIPA